MHGRRAITCIIFLVVAAPYFQTKLTKYLHGLHFISSSQYLSNHILDTLTEDRFVRTECIPLLITVAFRYT